MTHQERVSELTKELADLGWTSIEYVGLEHRKNEDDGINGDGYLFSAVAGESFVDHKGLLFAVWVSPYEGGVLIDPTPKVM